ncbi:MAG: TolC family protein [Fusobacterium necrophorum]|nr:TolC family protein [Fusobacterium necrophorum]
MKRQEKMKKWKKIIIFTVLITGVSCTNMTNSYQEAKQELQAYQEITRGYQLESEWWKEYQREELNNLVEKALQKNQDLKKASLNINAALYQANLIGADLVPNFSVSFSSSGSKNIKTGEASTIKHSGSVGISYEIDLWKKLSNSAKASEWEYKATIEDLEAAKLALINNVINSYFHLIYVRDVLEIVNKKVEQYAEMETIMKQRFQYGSINQLELEEVKQYLLTIQATKLSYEQEQKEQEQVLRNLLHMKPEETLEIKGKDLLSYSELQIDLDIPMSALGNRPDIKAYEYRLRKSFKNVQATQASLYPSISIQSTLSSGSNKIKNTFNIPIAYGNIGINLPFLNWNQIQWNIKTDENVYEMAKTNFEQGIVTALNEIDTYYFSLKQAEKTYQLQKNLWEHQKEIQKHYKNQYQNGVSDLYAWLNSSVKEEDARISLIKAKYTVLGSGNKICQSLGGKLVKI